MKYIQRLLLMLLLALPISVALATAVWSLVSAEGSWLSRLEAAAFFLSISGPVAGFIVSVVHTWLTAKTPSISFSRSVAIAAGLGVILGAVMGLAWSPVAMVSLGAWGFFLGSVYALLVRWFEKTISGRLVRE